MRFDGKRLGSVLLGFVLLAGVARAETASPEDTAKFLAGLPVSASSPLAPLEDTPAARQNEAFFDSTFQRVDRTQIDKVKAWGTEHINVRRKTLFYFFSGPDFLYANAFFPDTQTYVLAGLEPPGPIPDLTALPKGALPKALRGLEVSMRSILGLSFFQTKYMSGEFYYNPIRGTIPVLYIFMARSGKEVHSATLVQLDENGDISTDMSAPRKGAAKGVKITFSSPGGPEQTLYYFSANVIGDGFKSSGLEGFCDKLGRGDAFIKSASYLLQGRDFSGIRNFILSHSDAILQDDTGIPVALFNKTWDLTPYGNYVGPIHLFARAYQPALAALHRRSPKSPIDFSISYRYRPHEASLVWAVKKEATDEATPKATPKPENTKPESTPKPASAPAPASTPAPESASKPTAAPKADDKSNESKAKDSDATKSGDSEKKTDENMSGAGENANGGKPQDEKAKDEKANGAAAPAEPGSKAGESSPAPSGGIEPQDAKPDAQPSKPDATPQSGNTVVPKNETPAPAPSGTQAPSSDSSSDH